MECASQTDTYHYSLKLTALWVLQMGSQYYQTVRKCPLLFPPTSAQEEMLLPHTHSQSEETTSHYTIIINMATPGIHSINRVPYRKFC